jgi:hypothetical protein
MPTTAFCSAHLRDELVDRHWRALWIDSDGCLRTTRPELDCNLDFERPETVFACGQEAALILTERYLHSGRFDAAPEAHLTMPGSAGTDNYADLT